MFRQAGIWALTALLLIGAIPASAAELTVAQQIAKLKTGEKTKVELIGGGTLKGRMGPATADQFSLEPVSSGAQGSARIVLFSDVRSVKHDGLTTGAKWGIFAAIWVAVGIAAKFAT